MKKMTAEQIDDAKHEKCMMEIAELDVDMILDYTEIYGETIEEIMSNIKVCDEIKPYIRKVLERRFFERSINPDWVYEENRKRAARYIANGIIGAPKHFGTSLDEAIKYFQVSNLLAPYLEKELSKRLSGFSKEEREKVYHSDSVDQMTCSEYAGYIDGYVESVTEAAERAARESVLVTSSVWTRINSEVSVCSFRMRGTKRAMDVIERYGKDRKRLKEVLSIIDVIDEMRPYFDEVINGFLAGKRKHPD